MNKLAPSILAADFSCLGTEIAKVESAGAEYLHIDVMDGCFVPSISFGTPIIKSIRRDSRMIFDCHLMVNEPDRFIETYAEAGADIITVHAEACIHLDRTLQKIRECGKKAGVALNPATPLSVLDYVYDYADLILLMSVNPGFGGQKLIPSVYEKLKELRMLMQKHGSHAELEVDGGITEENVSEILRAGAEIIVSGSSIFCGDAYANVRRFKEVLHSEAE